MSALSAATVFAQTPPVATLGETLDGDRIRILNNGGAALDVSSLSYDHAVTLDPLSTERIEVLRGPGALQYGGSTVAVRSAVWSM